MEVRRARVSLLEGQTVSVEVRAFDSSTYVPQAEAAVCGGRFAVETPELSSWYRVAFAGQAALAGCATDAYPRYESPSRD